jgi:hypothetical protein
MAWPTSQDYNEAIQNPQLSFSDPELRSGQAVVNALGIPMPRSGNFADVYEFRCPSGNTWAIKCFTRQIYGLRERYSEISSWSLGVHLCKQEYVHSNPVLRWHRGTRQRRVDSHRR